MGEMEFKNINKIYPNGVQAVFDFNLHVKQGEFIVFVGPSGCGKSTVLRMVAGLEKITGGELLIDGRVVNKLPPVDRDISVVFQDYALYGNMTVYDNVGMSLRVRHKKPEDIYDKVVETSHFLHISEYLNRLPGQLSGGQKQRVSLGRAIARQPKVFLMDEPLSNLDAKLRTATRAEITRIQKTLGVTTIYVTHDQVEAMTMADRIVVIQKGIIQQVGTPKEIYDKPGNVFVAGFIGTPPMNFFSALVKDGMLVTENQSLSLPEEVLPALSRYERKKILVGIRPEHIELHECKTKDSIKLEVMEKEYLGSCYYVFLKFGEKILTAKADRNLNLDCESLGVSFAMQFMHFFDAESTDRIV